MRLAPLQPPSFNQQRPEPKLLDYIVLGHFPLNKRKVPFVYPWTPKLPVVPFSPGSLNYMALHPDNIGQLEYNRGPYIEVPINVVAGIPRNSK